MAPNGWHLTKVGALAASVRNALVGGPFGSELVSKDYVILGVPVIRGQNMSGRWVEGEFVFVSEEQADRLSANLARPGDLVFTQRGTIGQVSLVPEKPFSRYLVSQSQMKLTVNREYADPIFLYYLFTSREQQDYVKRNAIQTGVPHTNLGILRETPILLPPLPQQQTISRLLGTLDDKIELNRRVNETLEAMARTLFKSWFVDFDPVRAKVEGRQPPGLDAATAAVFSDSFEDSTLGSIPKGWQSGTLGSVVTLLSGGTPNKSNSAYWNGTIPWLSAKDMKTSRILDTQDHVTEEGAANGTRVVEAGAILILVRGMTLHNDLPICWATRRLAFNQDVKAAVPVDKHLGEYAYLWLLENKTGLMGLVDSASHGTGRIHTDMLVKQPLVVPPEAVLDRFNALVRPLLDRASLNDHEAVELAAVRDALLPKLLSGEVKVPGHDPGE